MWVKILNRRYRYNRPTNLGVDENGNKVLGNCDPPEAQNKAIRVLAGLKDLEELDVNIHEFVHGSDFKKNSEEWVSEFSSDLARFLWRLGYRK